MPKPPVKIGDIYESKDKREDGRQVRVVNPVSEEPDRWFCVRVFDGRPGPRKHGVKLSTKNLQGRWKLIRGGDDTLQRLLTRLKDVHPNDIASSLRPLRSAWLEADCPGLRRDS